MTVDIQRHQKSLENAVRLIKTADMLLVVAGAGMGVDSGLPDFRGNQGFWRAYPALKRSGLDFISIASPHAFRKRPEMAWGFYGHRLNLYRQTLPHEGYEILHRWGQNIVDSPMVFTTNVDGHFQKAGLDTRLITECHGSIHHFQCLQACNDDIWSADRFTPQVDEENCVLLNDPPHCPHCGGLARPNIYMFGDSGWIEDRTHAQQRNLERWLQRAKRVLIIEIGAGTAISTARDFTQAISHHWRTPVIRINPQDAEISGHPEHVSLRLNALQALQAMDDMFKTASAA